MFDFIRKKTTPESHPVQTQYITAIHKILSSPFWDGTDEMIKNYMPSDLNNSTIKHAIKTYSKK